LGGGLNVSLSSHVLVPKLQIQISIRIHTAVPKLNKNNVEEASKAIPVSGREGVLDCEMLMISQCLDSRLTDDSEIVSLKHRPRSSPQKHMLFVSGIYLC
jgi:hypothetical protein